MTIETHFICIVSAVEVLFGHSAVAKDLIKAVQVPAEYKREMQGIADAAGVPYDQVLTAKYIILNMPTFLYTLLNVLSAFDSKHQVDGNEIIFHFH